MVTALLVAAGVVGAIIGGVWRIALVFQADDSWNAAVGGEMVVRGLYADDLRALVDSLPGGLLMANFREANSEGSAWVFRLQTVEASSDYASSSPSGRKGNWVCYHGFRDFVDGCFDRGASSMSLINPKGKKTMYHNPSEFHRVLPSFYERQLGNDSYPVQFGELCSHPGREYIPPSGIPPSDEPARLEKG